MLPLREETHQNPSKKQRLHQDDNITQPDNVDFEIGNTPEETTTTEDIHNCEIIDPHIEIIDDSQNEPFAFTNDRYIETKLLKILEEIGAPLYAFDVIMEWGFEAQQSHYNFQPKAQTYRTQLDHLAKMTCLQDMYPKVVEVPLAKDNFKMPVVCFDFIPMLLSLFNDQDINQLDNLVINPDDPFGKYVSPDGRLDEINSGAFYNLAYENMCTKPNDFLCPLVFTTDKTTLSANANLHSHPFMMTTSLFKSEVSVASVPLVL
jgi:hypothetical protein